MDENLSPGLARLLAEAGHDAVHVRDVGLAAAADTAILEAATVDDRVIISADTDFGVLLANRRLSKPSILLLRRQTGRRSYQQARLLLDNLGQCADDLASGAVVVITDERLRVRRLPLLPS